MSKQCLIVGCGSHAHSVISIIESSNANYEISGLVDISHDYNPNEEKSGYKIVLSLKELLTAPSLYAHLDIFLAVGDNQIRKKIFQELKRNNLNLPNIIASTAYVDRTVQLGQGNIISHFAVINAQSKIRDNNLINTGAIIEHDCLIGNHNHIAPKALMCGNVSINDLILLGANSVVLPFLSIHRGTSLGAGGLLNRNTDVSGKTLTGVPAKVKKK